MASSSSNTSSRGPIGIGRPSAASRFDSLQDLLAQAGYKETRIHTPNNSTLQKHPPLRKRASRASHALWTASLSAHSSASGSSSSASSSSQQRRRRPSLPHAFFSVPVPTRTASTGADPKLTANIALPILSAAPAIVPLPTPPLPSAQSFTDSPSDQHQDGQSHYLGRMRSVDLLRDTLDQVQHFQLVISTPPHSLSASASASSSSSHMSSLGKLIKTSVLDSPSLSQSASLPKLFLSSPRGLSEPQQITLESIPDPPPPSPDPSHAQSEFASPGFAVGLGLAMLNFFGLGATVESPSRPSSSASTAAALANTPSTKSVGSPRTISSESIEAELDKILAGQRSCHSPVQPKKKRSQLQRTGTDPSSPWLPYQMERRPTSASLEVIKPIRIKNGKKRRSASSDSPGSSSTNDDAENRLRRVSSCSSSSSSSGKSGMSHSQLDRIGAALRGGAGSLGRARSVSALRNDVEMTRAAREGQLAFEEDQRTSKPTSEVFVADQSSTAVKPSKTALGEVRAVAQPESPGSSKNSSNPTPSQVKNDDPFICSQAEAPSKMAIMSQFTLTPSSSLISAIAQESHTDSMRRKVSPLSSITMSSNAFSGANQGANPIVDSSSAAVLKARNLNHGRTPTSASVPADENAKPSMIPVRSRASILNISHRDVRRGRQASHPPTTTPTS